MPDKKIKIALADDQTLFRQGVSVALKSESQFDLVGDAENGEELLALLRTKPVDVVLLDLNMPVLNGWETLARLQKEFPNCRVIIVSDFVEEVKIKQLVQQGARGFIPKYSGFETLINSIFEVHKAGYFFAQRISKNLVNDLLLENSIEPHFLDQPLDEKELEILLQVCKDLLNKEIASNMNMSERHMLRIKAGLFEKTGTKTNTGLILYAIKKRLFFVAP